MREGLLTKEAKTYIQRCISFDTQTTSYFYRCYKAQETGLPSNIESILNLLVDNKISVDYIPYTMENLLFSNEKKEYVKECIFAFEKLYYGKTVSDTYCRGTAESVIEMYDGLRTQNYFGFAELYHSIYVILLKVCYIQLTHTKYSIDKKMNLLCAFMDKRLCRILIPELILAKRYFERGQAYTFFGKIQNGRKDKIKNIKNMAWDLFHLRMLEMGCAYKTLEKVDAIIPYFCTYDKRLLEVKECYELKSMAINYRTQERFSFYSNVDEIVDYLKEVSTGEKLLNRLPRRNTCNIQELIQELENEITCI